MRLKCFCWVKNICKPLILLSCSRSQTHTRLSKKLLFELHQHFQVIFSLLFFAFAFLYTDLYVLETSFLLLINYFLLNLTQQLKFFRRRFEIVVPCTYNVQFSCLFSGSIEVLMEEKKKVSVVEESS